MRHKRLGKRMIAATFFTVLLTSCGAPVSTPAPAATVVATPGAGDLPSSTPRTAGPTPAVTVPAARPTAGVVSEATPIWKPSKAPQTEGAILVYEETLMIRPPFYTGPLPLRFKAGRKPPVPFMGQGATAYNDFGDFRNTFVYTDPVMEFSAIAEGAITTDRSGRVLAEAHFLDFVRKEGGEAIGMEIEEFHYDQSGKLTFKSKSYFDFPMGFKKKENEVFGKKQRDYYFVWPAGF